MRLFHAVILILLAASWSCSGKAAAGADRTGAGAGPMQYATLLTIDQQPDYTVVTVADPWNAPALLARYVLVDSGCPVPDNVPDGILLQVPLASAVVFSNVHAALLHELGHADVVTGVADAHYITDSVVVRGVADGTVADCGTATDPDIEKIAMLQPDAVLFSPYSAADGVAARLARTTVPTVMCADYLEADPLGRAEWMRFYGRLIGEGSRADSLFACVAAQYNRTKALTANAAGRPSVLMDTRYGDVWYVPVAGSTTDALITDAGGTNPFSSLGHGDSRPLSAEQVLAVAADADVWLVRYFAPAPMDLAAFRASAAEIPHFSAARRGDVYGCNTAVSPFYDVVPFHPQFILADMARILHPELADSLAPSPYSFYQRLCAR